MEFFKDWLENKVSIHAPVRGATVNISRPGVRPESFNPRPRAGGDREKPDLIKMIRVSIHAPVRGATSEDNLDPKG